jgi:hypothetical protein
MIVNIITPATAIIGIVPVLKNAKTIKAVLAVRNGTPHPDAQDGVQKIGRINVESFGETIDIGINKRVGETPICIILIYSLIS